MRIRAKKRFKSGISYLEFDRRVSDPVNITKYDNGEIHSLLSRFRRCLVNTVDGTAYIRYLNHDDSNYYPDGSPALLTGEEGDVMVYFPSYWYKYEKIDENLFRYYISIKEIEGGIFMEESLVGAYKGYVSEEILYSKSGTVPTGSVSQIDFKQYAANKGTGFQIIDYQQHCTLAMMCYARYTTRDSQSVLGQSMQSYGSPSGNTNMLGNRDTQHTTSTYVNFLGVEAIHSGMYEWVQGVIVPNGDGLWSISHPDGTIRQKQAVIGSGYITAMALEDGEYFDLVPTAVGGSEETGYADYFMRSATPGTVLARAYFNNSPYGGVNCTFTYDSADYSTSSVSSRLAFRGKIISV